MTVLSGRQIQYRLHEIFAGNSRDVKMIRNPKYYLRLGTSTIILPNGKRYWPNERPQTRHRPITLKPGETALVSTVERMTMPLHLAGVIGPIVELSNQGLFFFGGMQVDPGFGRGLDGSVGTNATQLSFYLANISAEPIRLIPEETKIGAIFFSPVDGTHFTYPTELNPVDLELPARR